MNIKVDTSMLGRTGLKVSKIGFAGILAMDESQENSDMYVRYAIDHGINYFDVAPSYGNAEIILGDSIKYLRKDIVLACKTGKFELEEGKAEFLNSLKLLHTDYFDIYQLHGLTDDDQLEMAFSKNGIMSFLEEAKKKGVIRNIGFSAHNEDIALKALSMYDFDTVLFPLNWSMNISLGVGDRLMAKAKTRNMGIMGLKTLAHRQLKENEEKEFPKCWYKPIDLKDTKFAISALNYILSLKVHSIITPGHIEYLKFAVEKYPEYCDMNMEKKSKKFLQEKLNKPDEEVLPNI